jgi:hypothetical protein
MIFRIILFGVNFASTSLWAFSFWVMLFSPSHSLLWHERIIPILVTEVALSTFAVAANIVYAVWFLHPKNIKKQDFLVAVAKT